MPSSSLNRSKAASLMVAGLKLARVATAGSFTYPSCIAFASG